LRRLKRRDVRRLGAVEPCHALQKRGCCLLSLTNIDAGPAGRWCFLVLVVQKTASNNPPTIQHLSNTKVQQTKGCREIVASNTVAARRFFARKISVQNSQKKSVARGSARFAPQLWRPISLNAAPISRPISATSCAVMSARKVHGMRRRYRRAWAWRRVSSGGWFGLSTLDYPPPRFSAP
jgi:hypothetical protein